MVFFENENKQSNQHLFHKKQALRLLSVIVINKHIKDRMIESIPFDVRLLCWEYLSVRDYGSLAMTCRALEHDRRHLDPTRFVCIPSSTTINNNEEALQRSIVLHQKDPIILRLEAPLPLLQHVSLPAVTELELATSLPVIVSARIFPHVRKVTLCGNTRFYDQKQQMGRLLQNVETLVIQQKDDLCLNGHDLRECKLLHTLILEDCRLQLTKCEATDARCKSDFLSWIKGPLRSVTLNGIQCSAEPNFSQDMLMNFVRRRPLLHYFESDALTKVNKARLRSELPAIQIV